MLRQRIVIAIFFAVLSSIGLQRSAEGAILFDTFGPDNSYPPSFVLWALGAEDAWEQGEGFTPPAGSFHLDKIEAAISLAAGPNEVVLSLYDTQSGLPGSVIEAFAFSGAMGPLGEVNPVLSAQSGLRPILTGGTQYWLIGSVPDPTLTTAAWAHSAHTGPHAVRFSGGSWFLRSDLQGAFRIQGTPVGGQAVIPEPAAFFGFLFGLVHLAGFKRRP